MDVLEQTKPVTPEPALPVASEAARRPARPDTGRNTLIFVLCLYGVLGVIASLIWG
jgi:hypothetical protein